MIINNTIIKIYRKNLAKREIVPVINQKEKFKRLFFYR